MGRRTRFPRTTSGHLRLNLGLTQTELSLYLGITRDSLNKHETGGRALASEAHTRLIRLLLLLPWATARLALPEVALPPAPPPVPPATLPVPPDASQAPTVRKLAKTTRLRAALLRYEVEDLVARQALLARRRRAVAELQAPPPPTLPAAVLADEAPELTAFLLHRLTDYVAADSAPTSALHPAAVAYQHLRLHLLETEAATLAAWVQ